MMKIKLLFLVFFGLYGMSYSQNRPIQKSAFHNVNEGGFLSEIKLEKPPTKGTVYVSDRWNKGSLTLSSGKLIEGYFLRYDIKNNFIEIKIENLSTVKAIRGEKVDEIRWFSAEHNEDEIFINSTAVSKEFASTFLKTVGHKEGRYPLYIQYFTTLIRSNYIVAIDAGEKEDKIVINRKFYMKLDQELVELPKTKRKLSSLFVDLEKEASSYIKKNHLKYNDEREIINFVTYMNSLSEN